MRVAILGAPGTGKSTLERDLLASTNSPRQWQLLHDSAALQTMEQRLLQAPDEQTRQQAIAAHVLQPAAAELILLTALEPTPKATDFLPAQRQQLDESLRRALTQLRLPYALLYGSASTRCQAALQAIEVALREPIAYPKQHSQWRWPCEKCSDPDCEHRLFLDLIK